MLIEDAEHYLHAKRRRDEKTTGNPYPVHLTMASYDKRRGGSPTGWDLILAICEAEWKQHCADEFAKHLEEEWQELTF